MRHFLLLGELNEPALALFTQLLLDRPGSHPFSASATADLSLITLPVHRSPCHPLEGVSWLFSRGVDGVTHWHEKEPKVCVGSLICAAC